MLVQMLVQTLVLALVRTWIVLKCWCKPWCKPLRRLFGLKNAGAKVGAKPGADPGAQLNRPKMLVQTLVQIVWSQKCWCKCWCKPWCGPLCAVESSWNVGANVGAKPGADPGAQLNRPKMLVQMLARTLGPHQGSHQVAHQGARQGLHQLFWDQGQTSSMERAFGNPLTLLSAGRTCKLESWTRGESWMNLIGWGPTVPRDSWFYRSFLWVPSSKYPRCYKCNAKCRRRLFSNDGARDAITLKVAGSPCVVIHYKLFYSHLNHIQQSLCFQILVLRKFQGLFIVWQWTWTQRSDCKVFADIRKEYPTVATVGGHP